jgi:hypothetical protein
MTPRGTQNNSAILLKPFEFLELLSLLGNSICDQRWRSDSNSSCKAIATATKLINPI